MSEKNEFEYAEKLDAAEVAGYLMKVADGLKGRHLTLQGKGQSITLLPEEMVKLKVKAEAREGKGEIEFEIAWKEGYVVGAQKLEIGAESAPASTSTQPKPSVQASKRESPTA